MELDPAYVDVAVTRWQAFTGKAAILDGDGRSFAEVGGRAGAGMKGRMGPPPEADRDPPASRATAASAPGTTTSREPPDGIPRCPKHLAPVARTEWRRVARALYAMGVLTADRPGRARRLLPVLRQVGRGRGEAQGDPAAPEDPLGLRAAVALDRDRQQAAGADGPLHGRARHDPGLAQPGGATDPRMQLPADDRRSHRSTRRSPSEVLRGGGWPRIAGRLRRWAVVGARRP